jgi:hypothetical protein
MKKSILVFSMVSMLSIGGISKAAAQDQPQPKKDTVNIDTDAKPEFYYPVEDEKTAKDTDKKGFPVVAIIGGVVVVGALAAFFVLKKKK